MKARTIRSHDFGAPSQPRPHRAGPSMVSPFTWAHCGRFHLLARQRNPPGETRNGLPHPVVPSATTKSYQVLSASTELLLDAKTFSALNGRDAEIDPKAGWRFSTRKAIEGRNVNGSQQAHRAGWRPAMGAGRLLDRPDLN